MTWSGHKIAHDMTAELSWHMRICDQGPLLLTWFNFNLSMDK